MAKIFNFKLTILISLIHQKAFQFYNIFQFFLKVNQNIFLQ